ncbi:MULTISPECIES: PAS domain S-box protein [Methylomonas]|uniref:histidine kinase n=1 Tax=Methylomonas methanica TaxID=421 RepID=A0ABY2CM13_METMH|nr:MULTISPECIES: PAS domain S-box protein [Methylomonas]TCV83621.1 PAS domain S-box-containing protein [Methylomonas methanica]
MITLPNVSRRLKLFLSILLPFAACFLQILLWDVIQPFVFFLFYPAVFFSGRLGGLVGGVLATLISVLLINWFFIEPVHSFAFSKSIHIAAVAVFFIVGCLMALVHYQLERNTSTLLETQRNLQHALAKTHVAEARFKAMFQQSPLGTALIDSHTGHLYEVNQTYADIVGRPLEQLTDIDWMQITHPDDIQADLDNMARLNAGEIDGFQMNKRYIRPDQSIVWISMTIAPVKVSNGESPRHLCLIKDITQRLETEKQLAEAQAIAAKFHSEQRYAALVDQDIVGIAEADLTGRLTFVNDRYCAITGHTREQLLGREVLSITHPDDREHNADQFAHMAASGKSFVIEKRYVRADGEISWALNTVSAIRDESGLPVTFSAMVLDITERKQQEKRLQQTLDLLHLAERSATAGAWSWDIKSGELEWSDALFILFGLSPETASASFDTWHSVLHPDDREEVENKIALAIRDRHALVSTYRIVLPDASMRWIDTYGNASYNAAGEPLRFAGLCVDVTQRKQADSLLRDSEQRFRKLFEHLPVAYQSLDIDGRWLDCNQKMADLLGFDSPEQMAGLDFVDYWHKVLREGFTPAYDHFKTTHSIDGEIQLYRRDGQLIDVIVAGRIQRDAEGKFMRTHCVVIDISERHVLERAMRELNSSLERKVAERTEALRISESRAKQILASHPIAVMLIDGQGIIQDANKKAGELIRCAPEALLGCSVDDLIPSVKRHNHAQHRAEYAQSPQHRQMSANREVSVLANDGVEIPVEIGLGPITLEGVPHVIVALNDISRRKQAEQALRESQENLERAQAVAKVGSWKLAGSTDYFAVSDETRRMFNFEGEGLVAYADWFAPIHPDDRAAVESAWHAACQGVPFEVVFRIEVQGQLKWIKGMAELTFDAANNVISGIGIVQDITSLKQAELQIRETMQYLQLATKASGIGVWTWNISSGQIEWDDRMHELYGIDNDGSAICYELWRSRIHPDDLLETEAALKVAVSNETSFAKIFRIVLADGRIRYIKPDSIFEYDFNGKQTRLIGINRDISEEIKQQDILHEARQAAEAANQAKSSFLANMSHEIRTPMNAIIGLSSLVLDTELTRQQRDYLGKVQAASKSLLNLINDILDYSKIEAGHLHFEKAPFRLEDVIHNTTLLFSLRLEEKGLRFTAELGADLPSVLIGDSMRLEQVLNNLLGNAIKFTEHGSISLKVELVPLLDASPNVAILRFSIRDTGIGIRQEQLEQLFTPFTQADTTISRRFGGTGLGLSISRRLVELMGGEIGVSSIEGQGSIFTFTARFESASPQLAATVEANSLADSRTLESSSLISTIRGAEILLVEDSPTNQLVAQKFLEKMQLNVTLAVNGLEAVHWVSKKAFDAVLMDVQMPIMDGYEATRQIRALPEGQQLPIIAISASVMADAKQACLEAGMNDHVPKPFNIELLTKSLLKWIKPRAHQPTPLLDTNSEATIVQPKLVKIDQVALQPLLLELERFLSENMLDAKKVAGRIDTLLGNTSLATAFFAVSDLVRKMRFKDALSALDAFKRQLD